MGCGVRKCILKVILLLCGELLGKECGYLNTNYWNSTCDTKEHLHLSGGIGDKQKVDLR